MRIVIILIAVLFVPSLVRAEAPDNRIEVTGSAELKVVPDQFVLHGEVVTFHKKLQDATSQNQKRVAKISKQIQKLGVPRKYVVTNEISVNVVNEGYRERGNFRLLGYRVSRNVRIVLHDPKKIQPAFKDLFSIGIDRLSMTTHHSNAASFVEKAEMQAAKGARAKAGRLASTLGRRLGPARMIHEDHASSQQTRSFTYTADTPNLGDELSLDKLRITASVRVVFELI